MKLLNCTRCHDIVALTGIERNCLCGKSKGRYKTDGVKAEYSGDFARILGMRNNEYERAKHGVNYTWFIIPEGYNIKKIK